MIQHPTIAAALAEQRRAAFMAEAETARLAREARAARNGGDRSAKWPAALASRRAGSPASQPPAAAWPACAPRAPVERVRRARWPARSPRPNQSARSLHPQHPKHHPHGSRKCPDLVSGTITAGSSQEGTVTALAVITVTSVVFLEGTAAGPASTKRKSTLA